MGNLTSKRPNRVQPRTDVQNRITKRIVELKKSGMGFRNISKQLEAEGLAKMSKSTVENRWKQTQDPTKSATINPFNSSKLKVLSKKETKLQNRITYKQMVEEANQSICDMQIQRSEDPEDLENILKIKKQLKEFTLDTLYDSKVLKQFKLHCKTKRIPLPTAIVEAVGSFGEFVAQQEEMGDNLVSYIEEKLENVLKREQQEQLEKRFQERMLKFKCSKCGRNSGLYVVSGIIVCDCGFLYKPLCEECGNQLGFDEAKHVFVCGKCHMIFRLPTPKPGDFKSIRELRLTVVPPF